MWLGERQPGGRGIGGAKARSWLTAAEQFQDKAGLTAARYYDFGAIGRVRITTGDPYMMACAKGDPGQMSSGLRQMLMYEKRGP